MVEETVGVRVMQYFIKYLFCTTTRGTTNYFYFFVPPGKMFPRCFKIRQSTMFHCRTNTGTFKISEHHIQHTHSFAQNIFNTHLHFCHCCHRAENSYQYHCEKVKTILKKKIMSISDQCNNNYLLLVPPTNGTTTTTHVPVIARVSKAQGVICSFQLPNFHLQFLVSFVLNAYSLFQHKILVPQPFVFQSYSGRRFGRDSRRVGFDGGDFICTITSQFCFVILLRVFHLLFNLCHVSFGEHGTVQFFVRRGTEVSSLAHDNVTAAVVVLELLKITFVGTDFGEWLVFVG